MAEAAVPQLVMPVGSRENQRSKSLRILLEGRLTIRLAHRGRIWAECRGTEQTWELGYAKGRWYCNCLVRSGKCSHLLALQMVVVKPEGT